jgi:hypothetical protein
MTRLQTLRAKNEAPELPEMGLGAYLAEHLFDAGPVSMAAMGAVMLTWPDLRHWQEATGVDLQPWEARGLRRLSGEYLSSATEAEEANCPAPWSLAPTPESRSTISNALRGIFSSMRKH